jgi:hypothetical protein
MRIVAALSSQHQDQVIEKILRSRGEWEPPGAVPEKPAGILQETARRSSSSRG